MPFWGFWWIRWVGKLPGISCFLLPLNQSHIQPWAFCFPQLKSEIIWVPTLLQITLHYITLAYYNIRHQPKCNGHRSISRSYKSCSAVSSISQMNHISTAFPNCWRQTSLSKCQDSGVLTDEKFRCFYSLTLLASSLAVNERLKAHKRLCCFHFKFIPVLSTDFFPLLTSPARCRELPRSSPAHKKEAAGFSILPAKLFVWAPQNPPHKQRWD